MAAFACQKANIPAGTGVADQPEEIAPLEEMAGQVDFAFELQGERHFLAELRGRPLLLVFIRTSEITSQLYMRELVAAFGKIAGEWRFLVLTIEPSEAPFVEMYAEFEKLPFPAGVAEPAVIQGKSVLGVVPAVPATYFLDIRGRVVRRGTGVARADEIVETTDRLFE
jgi:hypothetical protein